jgi:hypothetical protein
MQIGELAIWQWKRMQIENFMKDVNLSVASDSLGT